MRVAVISAADRAGNTVSVWSLAMGMAYKQGRSVRVCYTGENAAIKRYIGHDEEKSDATRSLSQVSKLLQAHAIAPEELENYCIKVGPNLDLMDSSNASMTDDEIVELLTFVYERSTADFTICDIAYGFGDPVDESIIKLSDTVVIVSEPSWACLTTVKDILSKQKDDLLKDKHVMLLVNRYHGDIMPLKKMAALAGFTLRETCKLHWSAYINRGCNNQDIQSVILSATERDPRVVELNQDIKEITEYLLTKNNEKSRWEG